MAKVCHSCGKGPAFGNSRSHSMVATRRRFNPNLQKVRIDEGGTPRRVYVCTRCLKANRSPRPPTLQSAASAVGRVCVTRHGRSLNRSLLRRVVARARYAHLEERRQEINDPNVFPVADGDTGDNMARTLKAVRDALDRI